MKSSRFEKTEEDLTQDIPKISQIGRRRLGREEVSKAAKLAEDDGWTNRGEIPASFEPVNTPSLEPRRRKPGPKPSKIPQGKITMSGPAHVIEEIKDMADEKDMTTLGVIEILLKAYKSQYK